MDANAAAFQPSSVQAESNDDDRGSFHYFSSLSDDLALTILSFAAEVPFESDGMNWSASLTHTLPLVSRRIRDLVTSTDLLWRAALERRLENEPYLWDEGLRRIISDSETMHLSGDGGVGVLNYVGTDVRRDTADSSESASAPVGGPKYIDDADLIDKACTALQIGASSAQSLSDNVGICQRVYRAVVSRHIRYTGPVFYMHGSVRLGQEFGLHFFEPRYRLLISEVMGSFPVSARRGEPIALDSRVTQFPKFIYANHAPLAPGTAACIVEVRQCLIHPNGTADVFLVPSSYVWLERVWERPQSGRLFEAKVIRMGKKASQSLENSVVAAEERRIREQFESQGMPQGSIQAALQFISDNLYGNGDDDDREEGYEDR